MPDRRNSGDGIVIEPERLVTPGVAEVFDALRRGGAQARFVGGCVRNCLIGLPAGDRDVAVDAPAGQVVRMLRERDIGVKAFGLRYGVVMALPPAGGFVDVASLRLDVGSDGRRPEVRFGADWRQDAQRRDLTINALYADDTGEVHDWVGGIADLRERRVRFVGDARQRVREDALRILRFFRFHALYGTGRPDAEGLEACAAEAAGLAGLARERVLDEMRKLLQAPDPSCSLQAADRAGVLQQLLPGADPGGLTNLVALERRLGIAPNWRRRWLLLAASNAEDGLGRWPLSRAERQHLRLRIAALTKDPSPMEQGWRRGRAAAVDALLVAAARAERDGNCPRLAGDIQDARRAAGAALPVCAKDVLRMGVPAGPAVREALFAAERHWLGQGLRPTRDELLRRLQDSCARVERSPD